MRIPHGLRAALASQGAAPSAYQIQRSLRFNSADSAYLSRTPASAGNRKTWTWSGWVKRSGLGVDSYLFTGNNDATNTTLLRFTSTDKLRFFTRVGAGDYVNDTNAVFRDASAWYHVVCAIDTTAASAADRVKLYVNGINASLTATPTIPQNSDLYVNATNIHYIGALVVAGTYSSGYLADVHFIDGQALTPTGFAETNATTGQWVPKAYTGSYDNLLKISSSAYSTSGTPWNSSREWDDFFAQTLSDAVYAAVGTTHTVTFSPALTVSSEVKITKWDAQGIASSNYVLNGSITRTSGNFTNHVDTISSATLGGSLSSISLQTVGGSDAATVVELTVDGKPVRLNTVNGNGFHLDFADNSNNTASTLGKDTSGNGLNWTPSGFSVTAGAGNDSLVDTPTSYGTDTGAGGEVRGNYCTLNPLAGKLTVTLSDGNLTRSGSVANNRMGTIGMSSGKWYWEVLIQDVGAGTFIGVTTYESEPDNYAENYVYNSSGGKYIGTTLSSYGASYGVNDIIGVAYDADTGTLTCYKNNVSQGQLVTGIAKRAFPLSRTDGTGQHTFNFGQRPFAYTAPSGFKALVDTNIPVVVAKPNEVMDVKLYTGNSSTQTISGLGFSPDLVWIKSRSAATAHELTDSVRGATKSLSSNTTGAEATDSQGLTAFNSDGFSLGTDTNYNNNTATYVAWTWDAGSSTVTNTQGSITSQVRANASAGFSIATFTKTGNTNQTIGHGLGVAPSMVIVKTRQSSGYTGWAVYHASAGANGYLELNTTSAFITLGSTWNNTAPTSTVFTMGTGWTSTQDMVAYCFAPVAGYSSFGSYTGNGSTDGSFVYTGFAPAFVLIKRTDTTSNWTILDYKREGYNVDNDPLYSNLSNAEGTTDLLDITSNGFKLRSTDTSVNASSGTYIYAAFAQNPLQYARAR